MELIPCVEVHATGKLSVPCECCYCGSAQQVPEPPSLHTCTVCGHDFRTFATAGRVERMTLSEAAQIFYQHQPKRTA